MKILQVSHRVPYPLNEGGTIGIYNFTRGYHEANCEVTLFTLSANRFNLDETEVRKALEPYCTLHMFPIDTSIRTKDALKSLLGKGSYNTERFYNAEFEKALNDHLREFGEDYDLVQVEGTYVAMYADSILPHVECPVVLRQHNVEYQIWERRAKNTRNPLKRWYLNTLAKRLKQFEAAHLNQFHAIVPVTEDDGHLFKELGCTKPIYAAPAGIDMEMWKPREVDVIPFSVYHLGSLEWEPNLDAVNWFIKEVWPLVLEKAPKAQFFVGGKGMPESMKQMNIPGVVMVGEVKSAPKFVSDKSLSVVPLRSGSGIRLKILEAMAAGKANVSTTIGAQGIAVEPDFHMSIADTPEEMASKISELLLDDEMRETMAEKGRKMVMEFYSKESVIKRVLKFYNGLIQKMMIMATLESLGDLDILDENAIN